MHLFLVPVYNQAVSFKRLLRITPELSNYKMLLFTSLKYTYIVISKNNYIDWHVQKEEEGRHVSQPLSAP